MVPADEAASADVGVLAVDVVYCPAPGQVDCTALTLPAGSTAADALQASGVLARHGLDP
jgi:putative ubiquitin-RnfH superfamily antitoxin RatB of RatAB toxin-antitoxin module